MQAAAMIMMIETFQTQVPSGKSYYPLIIGHRPRSNGKILLLDYSRIKTKTVRVAHWWGRIPNRFRSRVDLVYRTVYSDIHLNDLLGSVEKRRTSCPGPGFLYGGGKCGFLCDFVTACIQHPPVSNDLTCPSSYFID